MSDEHKCQYRNCECVDELRGQIIRQRKMLERIQFFGGNRWPKEMATQFTNLMKDGAA